MLTTLLEQHRDAICADHRQALTALEAKMDQLQATVSEHGQKIISLENNSTLLDERVLALEQTCATLKDSNAKLQAKVIDLESRSRRNNVRIIGLPESIEGPRPTVFFAELLAELFPETLTSPPEIDRAHRALMARPQQGSKPRAVIVRLHYFQVKENILREARSKRGKLLFRGHHIAIYEDFAPEVVEQRSTYRGVLKSLYEAGHRPVLRFPARLFISSENGEKRRINSVAEAEDFLKSAKTGREEHQS